MGTHRFTIEGKEYQVEVGARSGGTVQVTVNGKTYSVELAGVAGAPAMPAPAAAPASAVPTPVPQASPAAGSGEVRAPISGVVLSVDVTVGQAVTAKTKLLVIEAMKMENEIAAGVDGVIKSVMVKAQQDVRQGDLLVTINPS